MLHLYADRCVPVAAEEHPLSDIDTLRREDAVVEVARAAVRTGVIDPDAESPDDGLAFFGDEAREERIGARARSAGGTERRIGVPLRSIGTRKSYSVVVPEMPPAQIMAWNGGGRKRSVTCE